MSAGRLGYSLDRLFLSAVISRKEDIVIHFPYQTGHPVSCQASKRSRSCRAFCCRKPENIIEMLAIFGYGKCLISGCRLVFFGERLSCCFRKIPWKISFRPHWNRYGEYRSYNGEDPHTHFGTLPIVRIPVASSHQRYCTRQTGRSAVLNLMKIAAIMLLAAFGDGEMRTLHRLVSLLAAQFLFCATLAYKKCTFVRSTHLPHYPIISA